MPQLLLLLGLGLLGLAALTCEAWQLPFIAPRRQQQHMHLQRRASSIVGPLAAAQTTRPAAPAPPTTTASSGGGGDDEKDKKPSQKEEEAEQRDDGPMDAVRACLWMLWACGRSIDEWTGADGSDPSPWEQGKLLEVLRGLIMRPIEGEWEAWVEQEKEVARTLKAELKGEEGGASPMSEEEEAEAEESASAVSMKGTSLI